MSRCCGQGVRSHIISFWRPHLLTELFCPMCRSLLEIYSPLKLRTTHRIVSTHFKGYGPDSLLYRTNLSTKVSFPVSASFTSEFLSNRDCSRTHHGWGSSVNKNYIGYRSGVWCHRKESRNCVEFSVLVCGIYLILGIALVLQASRSILCSFGIYLTRMVPLLFRQLRQDESAIFTDKSKAAKLCAPTLQQLNFVTKAFPSGLKLFFLSNVFVLFGPCSMRFKINLQNEIFWTSRGKSFILQVVLFNLCHGTLKYPLW